MGDLSRYTQPYGELLQTLLDWSYVSPLRRDWPREPLQLLVDGGDYQLGWAAADKLLVMTVANADNPEQPHRFVLAGGSGGIFTAFANAALYADQRRDRHLVSFTLDTAELAQMQALVYDYNARDEGEEDEFTGLDEEEGNRLAGFYDEHPDLAPEWWNQGPDLHIVEEKDLGEGAFIVRVWVKDATTAMQLQRLWTARKQEGEPADA